MEILVIYNASIFCNFRLYKKILKFARWIIQKVMWSESAQLANEAVMC